MYGACRRYISDVALFLPVAVSGDENRRKGIMSFGFLVVGDGVVPVVVEVVVILFVVPAVFGGSGDDAGGIVAHG